MGKEMPLSDANRAGTMEIIKSLILTLLMFVFIAQFIYPIPFFSAAVNYMTMAAVVVSLPFAGRGTKVICLGLFVCGAYLIYHAGAGWTQLIDALGKNTSLLVLLMAVPILGVPLKQGHYIGVLDALASRYMRKKQQMYWVTALFSHVLGVFMNLGAVPLTYEITARGPLAKYPGLIAKGLSRGFCAALLWSPNMVATALVLEYLKVDWQYYLPLGLLFAVISLVSGFLVELFSKEDQMAEEGLSSGEAIFPIINRVKLAHLSVAGIIFMALIVLIETKTKLSVIRTVPIIALIMPFIWLSLIGHRDKIKSGYADYFMNRINQYDGEVLLFTAAGFFSGALVFSGWAVKLSTYILLLPYQSKVVIGLAILVSIIVGSMVGLHPMVLVSAMASSLNPVSLGFAPVQLVLVLIAGWSLGATVSPISGTTLVVAGLTGKTPMEVGYANISQVLLVLITLTIYLALF